VAPAKARAKERAGIADRLSPFLLQLVESHERGDDGLARDLASARGVRDEQSGKELRVRVILTPLDHRPANTVDLAEVARRGGQVEATSRSFLRALVPVNHQ